MTSALIHGALTPSPRSSRGEGGVRGSVNTSAKLMSLTESIS